MAKRFLHDVSIRSKEANSTGIYSEQLINGTPLNKKDTHLMLVVDTTNGKHEQIAIPVPSLTKGSGENAFTFDNGFGNTIIIPEGKPTALTLAGNTLTLNFKQSNGETVTVNGDLSALAPTIDINVESWTRDPGTRRIVLKETDGTEHPLDLSDLVMTKGAKADGVITYTQNQNTIKISQLKYVEKTIPLTENTEQPVFDINAEQAEKAEIVNIRDDQGNEVSLETRKDTSGIFATSSLTGTYTFTFIVDPTEL